MFKRLGMFAVLAVCLFAIAIVMVGCSEWWEDDDEEEEEVELTPMEKLTGTYSLVEREVIWMGSTEEPPTSGTLRLRPEGNGWSTTFEFADRDAEARLGTTWTANTTAITFIDTDGFHWSEDYTLKGKFLTLDYFAPEWSETQTEKWRKID